ncbi:MAG: HlyD family efflux transporter periplasmic adaptor subunit [Bacteroidales bacterium]
MLCVIIFLAACSGRNQRSDAYGNFEAVETIISSEVQGVLLSYPVEQGTLLGKGVIAGKVDTVPLSLKRDQTLAQKKAALARLEGVQAQLEVQEEQKKNLLIEKKRVENLLKDKAIPEKQLDDLNGNIRVVESQMNSVRIQKNAIMAEIEGISSQVKQIDDQLKRSTIVNPVNGTVLESYVEPFELVTPGKPLYKIAGMDTLILRAYISGTDLASVKLGQEVLISIEDSQAATHKGIVRWVSPEAEFTPKIIQTREERVKLVYAMKISVANDGRLKIGMPAEVTFRSTENE